MARVQITDLSIPIDASTPFYPGDPEPRTCAASTIARDGFNVQSLQLGSHTGTHCDAPYHFLEDGLRIDQLPLDRFYGEAVVIDAVGHLPGEAITWSTVSRYSHLLTGAKIVLIRTDWSEHRHDDQYFDHPFLEGEACQEILARGVRTIGIDAINIDATPSDSVAGAQFPCHFHISSAEGVIIENLTNLAQVPDTGALFSAFPLRLTGSDGAPTRAVAMLASS